MLEARRDPVEGSQSRWMRQELPLPLPAELSVHRSSAKWRACGAWPGFAWGPWRSRTEVPAHPPPGGGWLGPLIPEGGPGKAGWGEGAACTRGDADPGAMRTPAPPPPFLPPPPPALFQAHQHAVQPAPPMKTRKVRAKEMEGEKERGEGERKRERQTDRERGEGKGGKERGREGGREGERQRESERERDAMRLAKLYDSMET